MLKKLCIKNINILLLAIFSCIANNMIANERDSISDINNMQIFRPVYSAYTLDFGSSSLLDTYLTPIRYEGYAIRLGYERIQAVKPNPERLLMQLSFGVDYSNVENIVKSRTMHYLSIDFNWMMLYRWRILPKLAISAGGGVGFDGGAIYNSINSNNPVSIKIHPHLDLSAMAVYNINLGKLPITLRYQATLPFLGAYFSPGYGESYYEIYVGNHDNLAHFGWWGNRFDMTNLITADLHIGNTSVRIGYRNTTHTSWINNLNTQIFTNCAVIGLSGEWTSLNPQKNVSEKAKVISAMY